MREIIKQKLWLGNAADARNVRRLLQTGVVAVVDLALEEPAAALARDLVYCRIPLVDGAGNPPERLATAIGMTAALIRQQTPTLVACSAGMSRAPAVTAAALATVNDESPDDCLKQLTADNPHDISPALWAGIRNALCDSTS
jgi:protein-tyrosine phosphatase